MKLCQNAQRSVEKLEPVRVILFCEWVTLYNFFGKLSQLLSQRLPIKKIPNGVSVCVRGVG